jgi:hypothetical protein
MRIQNIGSNLPSCWLGRLEEIRGMQIYTKLLDKDLAKMDTENSFHWPTKVRNI